MNTENNKRSCCFVSTVMTTSLSFHSTFISTLFWVTMHVCMCRFVWVGRGGGGDAGVMCPWGGMRMICALGDDATLYMGTADPLLIVGLNLFIILSLYLLIILSL